MKSTHTQKAYFGVTLQENTCTLSFVVSENILTSEPFSLCWQREKKKCVREKDAICPKTLLAIL